MVSGTAAASGRGDAGFATGGVRTGSLDLDGASVASGRAYAEICNKGVHGGCLGKER